MRYIQILVKQEYMDDKYKTELEHIVAMQNDPNVSEDELIGVLADILVEGFMWQLKGEKEESVEPVEKKARDLPQGFYY